jgi:hypothetical protein
VQRRFPSRGCEVERSSGILDRKPERVAHCQQDAFARFQTFEREQKRRRCAFYDVVAKTAARVWPWPWRGGIPRFNRRRQPATDILSPLSLTQRFECDPCGAAREELACVRFMLHR